MATVCAWGALIFLRLIATELEAVESALINLEEREKKAQRMRLEKPETASADEQKDVMVVHAA